MDGVAEAAERAGYEVMFMRYRQGEEDIGRELDSLLEMRVEGILFYPSSSLLIQDDGIVRGLQEVPCVLLDQAVDGLALPLVAGDSVGGMRQVADHLVSLGHTRIGYLAGPSSSWGAEIRLSAFREALREHGLRLSDKRVARYDWYLWGRAVRAAQRLFQSEPAPSAIAAANDVGAGAVMYVARDVGLQVPSDLAVVGYGDTMLSHTWTPPLTTVKQPVAELGEAACSELIRLIQNGEAEDRSAVHLLPTELVVRGSCGGTMLPIGTDVRTGERHAVLGERSMSETAHRGVSRQSRELRGAKEVVPQKRT
jgi:LacI family transcriptional regulator